MIETIKNYITSYIDFVPEVYAPFVLAGILFVLLSIFFRILQWAVLARLEELSKKTKTDIDDTFIKITRSIRPSFYYFFALWAALQFLTLPSIIASIADGILIAWIAYQIVISLHILIGYWLERKAHKEGHDVKHAYRFLSNIIKWSLWLVAILMVLSNFGINITSLIAGLGIGGIAVALALQNILSDLFSSFAIYFDKPFEVGDFVIVGEHMGTVERIGIKTTRLRALQGEEIVISNKELTSTRIQNFKKMQERRVEFHFGVIYETPKEKVRRVPEMVRAVFTELEKSSPVRFDRAHFKKFGDSSLDFEVVYFLLSSDYNVYMDTQQAINLALFECMHEEGIGFAYPTQTVYLAKN